MTLVVVIVLLGAAGVAYYLSGRPGPPWGRVALDGEQTIPSLVSALILVGGGIGAAVLAFWRTLGLRTTWLLFGLLLVFMGIDEFTLIHESLEARTGVDWQTLYAPLIVACAIAWSLVTLRLYQEHRYGFVLMMVGAFLWTVAQGLENLQWGAHDERVTGYGPMMLTEEVFEISGSACFLLALYATIWAHRTGQFSGSTRASTSSGRRGFTRDDQLSAGASPAD